MIKFNFNFNFNLFKKFNLGSTPEKPKQKHLIMGRNYSFSPIPTKTMDSMVMEETTDFLDLKDRLAVQKTVLQNNSDFDQSNIEVVTLDEKTTLLGITKPAQSILGGIFLYPAS